MVDKTKLSEIVETLRQAKAPSRDLDLAIHYALDHRSKTIWQYTTDYNFAIAHLGTVGYDWILGSVNGSLGGIPYACVGNTTQNFAATALLSLWLAYFRFELENPQ